MARYHLAYGMFEVTTWHEGILGRYPTKKRERRLVNTGKDYRDRPGYNRNTSRCLRVKREAAAFEALPARERGKSILSKFGSALAGLAGR